ncbi:hypothetical protein PWG15_15085 [Ensifer adhaerens]|uniref:hypothetical protein n=1 Tax=Ensifer adhaerens TaxID=106592 RepID=UPI0023A9727D|nr:hypothetical protein [Ensifer adhaerens]WDZ75927.1 hypothetical protein PWG15_15085 [Ensifer adhaerens]
MRATISLRSSMMAATAMPGSLAGLPAAAQEMGDLTGVAMVTGICERLVVAGEDMTNTCDGRLIQSIYRTGRTGFTVNIGSGGAVTFSGIEGKKPDADSQLQSVDRVIVNRGQDGGPISSKAVTGGCSYGNPFKGPATTKCEGTDAEKGAYVLQFRTDGTQPNLLNYGIEETANDADRAFRFGVWSGSRLKGDSANGCVMSRDTEGATTFMVHANVNEAFDLGFYNEAWSFKTETPPSAELLFDGKPYPAVSVEVLTPQQLVVRGGGEEGGFQAPIEQSVELMLRVDDTEVRVDLKGAPAAVARLWDCVGGR